MSISNYLKALVSEKTKLSTTLVDMDVNNTNGTFTELVPMVCDVNGDGITKYKVNTIKFTGFTGTSLGDTLKHIDTSEQTDMDDMFGSCINLLELDLSNIDTSSATTMKNMFSHTRAISTIDVSNFDTSNVTSMYCMFGHYGSSYGNSFTPSMFTSLPGIENLNTSKVTNMYCMFANCDGITELDLSTWDMSSVTTTNCMFLCSDKLKSIKLGTTSSKLTNIKSMFSSCRDLEYIDMRYMDLSSVTKSNANSILYLVPTTCEVIVKDDVAKDLLIDLHPEHNIKTVDELEAE